jgi:N-acetylneuraminic acid mutarotase
MIGGFDTNINKIVKTCSRYNIVTEKWQQLSSMLFEIMDASAFAINEYQIVVAGGVNSQSRNTDIVQIYDVRENSWRLFEICLSSPRRLVTMVSS